MKRGALFLPIILLATGCALFRSEERPVQHSRAAQVDYIEKYKDVAIKEMNRGGIPASIILAQAMLESGSGSSELARKANNHFGLKCTDEWTGATFGRKDDDRNPQGSLVDSCFRRYNNVAESYADYGEFMREYRRYRFLFELDRTDYKSWARGLQSAGYATSTEYSSRLIELIERFRLYQYDRAGTDWGRGSVSPSERSAISLRATTPSTA
jgi:flagellum-specific peptidoglycan hydrolase FlgJ